MVDRIIRVIRLGYDNAFYFSKIFGKTVDVTPKEFIEGGNKYI